MVSNVRFGHVGSNFPSFTAEGKEILYYATYKDGRVSIRDIMCADVLL